MTCSLISKVVFVVRASSFDNLLATEGLTHAQLMERDYLFEHASVRELRGDWLLFKWERVEWDPIKFACIFWIDSFMESLFPADYKFISINEHTFTLERRGSAEEPFNASAAVTINYK